MGPASWACLGILTSADGVSGDTWIVSFVPLAVVSTPHRTARRVVEAAASILQVPTSLLNHHIRSPELRKRA